MVFCIHSAHSNTKKRKKAIRFHLIYSFSFDWIALRLSLVVLLAPKHKHAISARFFVSFFLSKFAYQLYSSNVLAQKQLKFQLSRNDAVKRKPKEKWQLHKNRTESGTVIYLCASLFKSYCNSIFIHVCNKQVGFIKCFPRNSTLEFFSFIRARD